MNCKKLSGEDYQWVESVWDKLDKKLSYTAVKSRDKIPYSTQNGVHDDYSGINELHWWTNGFWGGLMWLMYAETQKDCYKETAQKSEEMMDRNFERVNTLHHDVGFMWHILAGASYRITGEEKSKMRNLLAAQVLMGRYNPDGEYIVAWNGKNHTGWSIIDSLMNLPLLYWASKEIGDERYARVAKKQADMAMRDHVRPDGSVVHIVSHDENKPGVIETIGGQGYGVGSSWSRGTAWALYGFTLSYVHTKDEKYLATAKQVAHYFIANAAVSDWLPLVDFRAPKEPVYYDATAGAIAASGLLEIANWVPENEKDMYISAAVSMLKALEAAWCDWSLEEDSILQNGTERYGDGPKPIIYGDYFFAEAILKLKGNEFLAW